MSQNNQKDVQDLDDISDSSSDDSIENCESGIGVIMEDIRGALSTENIEELATS